MAGMIKYLQSFRFKGLTVILGVFLAISVVLWTERGNYTNRTTERECPSAPASQECGRSAAEAI